jgi:hypothetical protein
MRRLLLVFIGFLLIGSPLYGQRKEIFRAFEDSIIHLHHEILNERNAVIRYQKNEKLLKRVEEAHQPRNCINYAVASINTISILPSTE